MTIQSSLAESEFSLPATLVDWPWKRRLNPFYHQARAESSARFRSFNAISPHAQRAFDLCNFELLASLAYPLESEDVERAGCDLMNLFFAFDAYTDIAVPHEAQQLASIVMDGLRNPDKPRPSGESVIGEIARQFSKISMKCASEVAHRRFIATFDMYTAAVVQETIDRAENHIRSIDDYFLVRRHTIGAMPSFVLLHFELELPEEVFEDPVIQRLENASIDMIILFNDICSYNIEQASGNDGHNIVTIVMHHKQLGLKEAIKWTGDYYLKLEKDFLVDLKSVPSFGKTLDVEVRRYVDGLGNWVRANECWHFESHRYFGTSGLEIQQSKRVVLLPRQKQTTFIQ
ncbi:Pentalenene synthase [Termitomyces sp. T112]|nr:Pentalenene synthase [Termitomyces sp. T112]